MNRYPARVETPRPTTKTYHAQAMDAYERAVKARHEGNIALALEEISNAIALDKQARSYLEYQRSRHGNNYVRHYGAQINMVQRNINTMSELAKVWSAQ